MTPSSHARLLVWGGSCVVCRRFCGASASDGERERLYTRNTNPGRDFREFAHPTPVVFRVRKPRPPEAKRWFTRHSKMGQHSNSALRLLTRSLGSLHTKLVIFLAALGGGYYSPWWLFSLVLGKHLFGGSPESGMFIFSLGRTWWFDSFSVLKVTLKAMSGTR